MSYAYEMESGQQLVVENDGNETLVALSSGSEGQQQSQATGFDTGKWSKAPTLYRVRKDLVLRLETSGGSQFLRVRGDRIERVRTEPDLEGAEKFSLRKSSHGVAMKPMAPMKPMKMKPMEPMKPMKPMKGMRPMEMRMGDMHMRMGGRDESQSQQRFCTGCGKAAQKEDSYCGSCGNKLSARA